jgi:hypothetical protein
VNPILTEQGEISMTTERNGIRRQIASLEAKLSRKPRRQASESSEYNILQALSGIEAMVKEACGESFMDEDMSMMKYMDEDDDYDVDIDMDDDMDYMDDDMDYMGYMDDDMDYMGYMDDDFEEDILLAEDGTDYPNVPTGAEEEITQDYLDDVLNEFKNPSSIVTDPTIQDVAPGGYVARLMRASSRLDKVAGYCEQQGSKKLAFRIDQIADAIDSKIKETRNV